MDASYFSTLILELLFLTLLATISLAQPQDQNQQQDMTDVIEDCCGRGITFASMGQNCSGLAGLPDVPMEHREACKAVFMSCCHHQRTSTDCDNGILHRLDVDRGDCSTFPEDSCATYSHGKECCDCCGLGIEAYSLGIPCNRMRVNTPCDHAFETCCTQTMHENDVVTEPSFDPCLNNPCSQTCQTTGTGFTCLCTNGYELAPDEVTCRDIDECEELLQPCPPGTQCLNQPGTFFCRRESGGISCPRGLRYNEVTRICDDINECQEGSDNCSPSRQYCHNIYKGFQCISRQSPLRACPQGFAPDQNNGCVDVNECTQGLARCRRNQRCVNLVGSHSCENCERGYRVDNRNECSIDIDECNPPDGRSPCLPHQFCYNMPGEYDCQNMCSFGARYTRGTCVDINECLEGTHQCSEMQECVNQEGGHLCRCPRGYRLTRSNRGCEDIDECTVLHNSCRGSCENTDGSYRCVCPDGYTLNENGFSCNDINECTMNLHNCDLDEQECFNTLGSYKCRSMECPEYYDRRLAGNQRECVKNTDLCPPNDRQCINNPVSRYSYSAMSLPSIPYLSSPVRLMTMDISKSHMSKVSFSFVAGNERNYFLVQKSRVTPYHIRVSLMLIQAVHGPYETDLHLLITTVTGSQLSQTVVIIHVDIGENLW